MPHHYREQYEDILTKIGWIGPGAGMLTVPESDNRERVRAQAQLPLMAHPGERFEYHFGYPLLSAVLEKASGQRLDELFDEAIFEPLRMCDSGFYLKDGALPRFGACYVPREVDGEMRLVAIEKAASCEKTVGPRREFAAGGDFGGVLTTVGDYARFGQMLLNGGELDGARVLGRKTVDLMTANHIGARNIDLAVGPNYGFGFGYSVRKSVDGSFMPGSAGQFGWGGAAGTYFFCDPAEDLAGLFFTQVFLYQFLPKANLGERFEKLTYEALI